MLERRCQCRLGIGGWVFHCEEMWRRAKASSHETRFTLRCMHEWHPRTVLASSAGKQAGLLALWGLLQHTQHFGGDFLCAPRGLQRIRHKTIFALVAAMQHVRPQTRQLYRMLKKKFRQLLSQKDLKLIAP